jgi:phosphate acetyltransferase
MANGIYITSAEGNTGKSTIALGIIKVLRDSRQKVGVYRPVTRSGTGQDYVLQLLLQVAGIDAEPARFVGATYETVHLDPHGAIGAIVERYHAVERNYDTVVILGSDYTDVSTPTELSFNARIAANLGAPVVLVLSGRQQDEQAPVNTPVFLGSARSAADIAQVAEVTVAELAAEHAQLSAVVVNRGDPDNLDHILAAVSETIADTHPVPVWTLPEDPALVAPTLQALMTALDGTLYAGDANLLNREVLGMIVSAMSMENVLNHLVPGAAIVIPGDRPEVLLAVLMAHEAGTFPVLTGIILNGGYTLSPTIERLLAGHGADLPIVQTDYTTFETVLRVVRTRGRYAAESPRKLELALSLFSQRVPARDVMTAVNIERASTVTPLMFEYELFNRARSNPKHIVLPEGEDDRILEAASEIIARGAAGLTILGEPDTIRERATALRLDLGDANIVSPLDPDLREQFAQTYTSLRAHKGMTVEQARDIVTDVSYFGTMMVQAGMADGMVSGATHTTAHTIRPAFEVIKTVPDVNVVSSVFLMCLADRVLVYGDCAVIPNPTAEQLADIAISAEATARQFGVEPRVAMLSYSTGSSGAGDDVEKVRAATDLVRKRRPDLPVEGPIQYDAAADATVAAAKLPDSDVAGHATVFIFPDLNTGNNTYKAVQRSAGAIAIGPVLQGLRRPINDLSRGASVPDIVNTIAITVVQAQGQQS